jgi:hypothetical protein
MALRNFSDHKTVSADYFRYLRKEPVMFLYWFNYDFPSVASNGRLAMNYELERKYKEVALLLLRYYGSIY